MLEGDFPNYFNLYSNNNQGTEVRYFMDPTAMAFVVDVCKKYSWEIVNDELIIVSESGVDTEEIKNFISEIQPKIEVPASNLHPNLRGEYKLAFLRKVQCPICKTRTDRMPDNTHKCPQGHGHLVTGSDLVRLAKLKPLDITIAKGKNDHNRNLKCPNCQQIMATIKYKSFNLDTCINCPYRWLDDDEIRQN
ncbi:zf-TFIIB domain-containing protein [Candidatus Saccharibacteria bacterium]|nr:zf-TFIIB domain-containing protein [Candidatus Saccharibacteria bacterium]